LYISVINYSLNVGFFLLGNVKYDRRGTSLVRIGQRVFALGGGYNPATTAIEEFVICANVWNQVLFVEEKLGCFGVQTLKSFFLQKW
jgi:hypothetical protein